MPSWNALLLMLLKIVGFGVTIVLIALYVFLEDKEALPSHLPGKAAQVYDHDLINDSEFAQCLQGD